MKKITAIAITLTAIGVAVKVGKNKLRKTSISVENLIQDGLVTANSSVLEKNSFTV